MSDKKSDAQYVAIWRLADIAGRAAVEALNVVPMTVIQRANPLDDSSPVTQSWHVPDGVCGFAYIRSKGNTAFGRWMKRATAARRDSYAGGVYVSVHEFGQSYQKKDAYARAFVKELVDNGIDGVWSESRLD